MKLIEHAFLNAAGTEVVSTRLVSDEQLEQYAVIQSPLLARLRPIVEEGERPDGETVAEYKIEPEKVTRRWVPLSPAGLPTSSPA